MKLLQPSTITDLYKTREILQDRIASIDALLLEFSESNGALKIEQQKPIAALVLPKAPKSPKQLRPEDRISKIKASPVSRNKNFQEALEAIEVLFSTEPKKQLSTFQVKSAISKLLGRKIKFYTTKHALTVCNKEGKVLLLGGRKDPSGRQRGGNGCKWTGEMPPKL